MIHVELVSPWDCTDQFYNFLVGRYSEVEWRDNYLFVLQNNNWEPVLWISPAKALCLEWVTWGEARYARSKQMSCKKSLLSYKTLILHGPISVSIFTPKENKLLVLPLTTEPS